MAENESLDGATTALHRRIEELTEELERSRYKGCGSYPRAIGEIESRLGIVGNPPLGEVVEAVRKLVTDLATERAAREQAEADRELLRGAAKTFETACSRAERERDTALALSTERYQELCRQAQRATDAETALASAQHRIAELEAYGNDCCARAVSGAVGNHLHRIAQLESALASARTALQRAHDELDGTWPRDRIILVNEIREHIREALLTSHPAPVAAPCAGCAAARELLGQALMVLVHWNNYQAEEGRSYIPEDENAAVLLRIQAWLEPKPAQPSVEPELQLTEDEQDWFLRNGYGMRAGPAQLRHLIDQLKLIAPLLSRAGLAIVPASDVPSPEERQVLEAIDGCCKFSLSELHERYPSLGPLADAVGAVREARRAAKETDHADRSRRETGDW